MTLIPAGVLSDLRTVLTDSLTDTATIDTVEYPCRIDDGRQSVTFGGFPVVVEAHEWIIRFSHTMTLTAGAIATVSGAQYVVREVIQPRGGVEVQALCVELVAATGGCHLPAPQTHTVTFTHRDGQTITAGVILGETNDNAMLGMTVAQYPWAVVIDQALTYPDNTTHVQSGDRISYQPIPGVTVRSTLGKASPPRDAFLPVLLYGYQGQD